MERRPRREPLPREPDPGSQGFTDRIYRDGYEGVIRAAVEIAESNESRIGIYESHPELTSDQRLASLYRVLLGWDYPPSDRRTWDEDLIRIRNRRIAPVVEDIVRSQRFRDLHGW